MRKPLLAILCLSLLSAVFAAVPAQTAAAEDYTDTADSVEMAEVDTAVVVIESASEFFLYTDEFGTISYSARMDMLDYYAAGQRPALATRSGGEARLDSLSQDYIRVSTSAAGVTEAKAYRRGNDLIFAVIRTVKIPSEESRISFLDPMDGVYSNLLKMPQTADFLKKCDKRTRQDVLSRISFPLTRLSFLPDGGIEARPTVASHLSRKDSAAVAPYLKDRIVYRWNGSEFRQEK